MPTLIKLHELHPSYLTLNSHIRPPSWETYGNSRELLVEILGWLYAQLGLWKWRNTYDFLENAAHLVLKIELLLTVLLRFERQAAIRNSAFWWVACLTHKAFSYLYSLILNLIGLDWHIFWYIQYLGDIWSNGVLVEFDRDGEGDREVLCMGTVVSIFEMDQNWN